MCLSDEYTIYHLIGLTHRLWDLYFTHIHGGIYEMNCSYICTPLYIALMTLKIDCVFLNYMNYIFFILVFASFIEIPTHFSYSR